MAVVQAPATEMCGSEARLCSAKAFGVEERSELAVGDAGIDGDGAGLGVERDDFVERLEGEESVFAIGDVVEAVAGAEDFKFGMSLDEVLDLLLGFGGVERLGAVFEVAGPVGEFVGGGPGGEARDGGTGDGGGGEFDKGAFVHWRDRRFLLFLERRHSTPDLRNRDTEKQERESRRPGKLGRSMLRPYKASIERGVLLVAESFDGVEAGGFPGGVDAEDDADEGAENEGGDDPEDGERGGEVSCVFEEQRDARAEGYADDAADGA